jgi:uncharacterized membrane protein
MGSRMLDYLGIAENSKLVRPTVGQRIGLVAVTFVAALVGILTKLVSHSDLAAWALLVSTIFAFYGLSAWIEHRAGRSPRSSR